MLAIVTLTLYIFSIFQSKIQYNYRYINPIIIYSTVNLVLVLTYEYCLYFEVVQILPDNDAIIIFILAWSSFLFGSVICLFLINYKVNKINNAKISFYFNILNNSKYLYSLYWIFTLLIILKYVIIINQYGLNFYTQMEAIRGDYINGNNRFGILNNACYILSIFLMMLRGYLDVFLKGYKKYFYTVSLLILVVLNDLTIGGTYWTVQSVTIYAIMFLLTSDFLKSVKLKKFLFSKNTIIFLCIIFIIKLLLLFRTDGALFKEISFSDYIMLYIGGNLASFFYFTSHPFPFAYPFQYELSGIVKPFIFFMNYIGFDWAIASDPEDFVALINRRWNTTIYTSYTYVSSGYIGVAVYNIFIGFLFNAMAIKFYFKNRINLLFFYAIILFYIIFSFRGALTEGSTFFLLMLISVVIGSIYDAD